MAMKAQVAGTYRPMSVDVEIICKNFQDKKKSGLILYQHFSCRDKKLKFPPTKICALLFANSAIEN